MVQAFMDFVDGNDAQVHSVHQKLRHELIDYSQERFLKVASEGLSSGQRHAVIRNPEIFAPAFEKANKIKGDKMPVLTKELSDLFLKNKEKIQSHENEFGDHEDSRESRHNSIASVMKDPPQMEHQKFFQLHCVKAIEIEGEEESPYLKANSLSIQEEDYSIMSQTDLSILWQQQTALKSKLKNYLLTLTKSVGLQTFSEVQQQRLFDLFETVKNSQPRTSPRS